ncbi:hypothetical protein EJ04DRAFT_166281 [Polyplosphaeria fusca]|uniref:Uncharacterized protein n=1 Tax=Polyplosphaeria fusca TaxID=682080 RepID=A0A9P4RC18_9PLEO|nr:hypothetical protein EJ04DRAFT_166281 [Polyplosphaeria fusca]
MPPKKDASAAGNDLNSLAGFDPKDTKLFAAAYLSSIGVDKYDYELMATLTGNTAGSLKKMLPKAKQKAISAHVSFATFIGATPGDNAAAAPAKSTAAKAAKGTSTKRKAAVDDVPTADGDEPDNKKAKTEESTEEKEPVKKARGRPKKADAAAPKTVKARRSKKAQKADDDADDDGVNGKATAEAGDGQDNDTNDDANEEV